MSSTQPRALHAQSGAITILVALMLLILLTVAAVGMSRNSFREVIISGTSRQGAMVRNAAEAGIEWSIYWMTGDNAGGVAATGVNLLALQSKLLLQDPLSGQPFDVVTQLPYAGIPSVASLQPDQLLPVPAGNTQGFSIALTRMGKLPIMDTSQGTTQGQFAPAQGNVTKQAPDLWAVRSDAQLEVGSVVFTHSKEAWITTPVH